MHVAQLGGLAQAWLLGPRCAVPCRAVWARAATHKKQLEGPAGLGSGGSRAAGLGFAEGGSAGAASAPIAVGNGVGGFIAAAPAGAGAGAAAGAGQDEAAFHMYRRLRSGAYKETLARAQQAAVEGLGR